MFIFHYLNYKIKNQKLIIKNKIKNILQKNILQK